ncbi:hypothetical protein C1M53_14600 [Mesorhizobium sp. Pch-S]|nr:hypothetical protein C1M53_14600 [Mesorhizobium sp. Pch-S]
MDGRQAVAGCRGSQSLGQFQQKCAAVLRLELRNNKELERFRVSVKNGNALTSAFIFPCQLKHFHIASDIFQSIQGFCWHSIAKTLLIFARADNQEAIDEW